MVPLVHIRKVMMWPWHVVRLVVIQSLKFAGLSMASWLTKSMNTMLAMLSRTDWRGLLLHEETWTVCSRVRPSILYSRNPRTRQSCWNFTVSMPDSSCLMLMFPCVVLLLIELLLCLWLYFVGNNRVLVDTAVVVIKRKQQIFVILRCSEDRSLLLTKVSKYFPFSAYIYHTYYFLN